VMQLANGDQSNEIEFIPRMSNDRRSTMNNGSLSLLCAFARRKSCSCETHYGAVNDVFVR
jgi:hypothetical protein